MMLLWNPDRCKTFFNKDVDSLLIEEAATLVGMVNNPSYYNPVRYPDRTPTDGMWCSIQMKEAHGYLDVAAYDSIKELPLDANPLQTPGSYVR